MPCSKVLASGVHHGRGLTTASSTSPLAHPFIKWPGGKRRLVSRISEIIPDKLVKGGISNYVEPFLGGGALFFNLQSRLDIDRVFLNDKSAALINVYEVARENVEELIERLRTLEEEFYKRSAGGREDYYYRIRDKFNERLAEDTDSTDVEAGALFIFLNKTCYNGVFRLNKSGQFNVPYGDCGNPRICNDNNLRAVSAALAHATLSHKDFKSFSRSVGELDTRSLVYIDPPYAIKNGTNGFLHYNNKIFSWEDQSELSRAVEKLRSSGARIIISNAAHQDIEELYPEPRFHRLTMSRSSTVGGTESSRRHVSEYVFTSYGLPRNANWEGWGK
nr:Dam family site-specific DNA-(adenine-N6)-methyltransferase [Ferrimicrobium acidiphilum]